MKVGLLIIGDEILQGDTLDTNSQFISEKLTSSGYEVAMKLTVSDDEQKIISGLDYLFNHNDIIISSGGLGPTKDDVTKIAICNYFNDKLIENKEVTSYLIDRYQKLGRVLDEVNKSQSNIPSKAKAIINPMGTAPIIVYQEESKTLLCLPGVPSEMRYLMENIILNYLETKFERTSISNEILKVIGIPESAIAVKLTEIENEIISSSSFQTKYKLAYLPQLGTVKLKIMASGNEEQESKAKLQKWKKDIKDKLSGFIYAEGDISIQDYVSNLLLGKNLSVGLIESCTGGYLSHQFTKLSGASNIFLGSMVTYHTDLKINLLGVKESTIIEHSVVSESVVKEMVIEGLIKIKSDIVVATTGYAEFNNANNQVKGGNVWIGVGNKNKVVCKEYRFNRSRMDNIQLFSISALDMLRKFILDNY